MSKLFWAMLAFISRLPVPTRWSQGLDFEEYSRGIVTFPLIGMLLGAIGGTVFVALQSGAAFHWRPVLRFDAGAADRRFSPRRSGGYL